MDTEKRKELVTRLTDEVVTEDELEEIIETKDSPTVYIGYAPTGVPHIGHFATLRKAADFIKAGFEFKVLIADVHAELDVEKTPPDLVEARSEVYEKAIKEMIKQSGVELDDVKFVRGSSYQHDRDYQKGYMQLMENATVNRAERASSEVVRHEDGMKASGVLYPFLQIMDCVALDADIAYAGTDQRRIYMLGRETLPKIGEDKITTVLYPLLGGLQGGKMSSSSPKSKISVLDSDKTIEENVMDSYCPEGEIEDNSLLGYVKYLLFPILVDTGRSFEIERPEKYGGDVSYESYDELENDFVSGDLHPQDLKKGAVNILKELLGPIREELLRRKDVLKQAYSNELVD